MEEKRGTIIAPRFQMNELNWKKGSPFPARRSLLRVEISYLPFLGG
jgi:hypothetical protein